MSLGKRLAVNTTVQITGRVLGLLLSAWLANILFSSLSLGSFAEYGTIFTYIQIFGAFGDLGLYLFLVKSLSQKAERPEVLLGNAFGFRLLATLFLLIVAVLVASLVPDSTYSLVTKTGIIVGAVVAGISLLFQALAAFFQQRLLSLRIIIPETLGKLATVLITLLVLKAGGGVIEVILAALAGGVLTLILGWLLIFRQVLVLPRFDLSVWRRFYPEVAPMALVVIFLLLHSRVGSVILSLYKGSQSTEMGVYSAAYKFYDLALVAPGIVAGNLFPVLSATFRKNSQHFKRVSDVSVLLSVTGGVIASFLLFALAPFVILLLANETYLQAVVPLRWLSLALALLFVSQHMTNVVLSAGRVANLVKPLVWVSILNAIVNIIFIPFLPIIVPAVATLFSETIFLIIKIKLVPKEMRPRFSLKMLLIIIAGSMFGAGVYFLSQGFLESYIAASFIFKLVTIFFLAMLPLILFISFIWLTKIISLDDLRLRGITHE